MCIRDSTVTVFLYCNSVSDCFYEEESEISDCIMKQAGTWMGSGSVSYTHLDVYKRQDPGTGKSAFSV